MDVFWTTRPELLVSFGMGVLLLMPIALEFAKRNLPVLFGVIIFLMLVQALSSQSAEMRMLWSQLAQIPQFLQILLFQWVDLIF